MCAGARPASAATRHTAQARVTSQLDTVRHARSGVLLFMQPSSGHLSRPDRNVASIGSLRPVSGRGAVAKAVCADRLPGASSERARPRHRVGGHREADLLGQPRSSVGEPWITARFRIKLDPCGSSCKRSRKLAFPGRLLRRWEFIGTSEACRLRRCLPRGRAPAGPVRRRGGSDGGCRADDGVTAGRGVRGVDRQGAFEARYVVAVVHASASSRCTAPSGSLRSHR